MTSGVAQAAEQRPERLRRKDAATPPVEDRYLTTDEAADIARFRPVTIARACRRREIAGASKVCGEWRIPESALRRWISGDFDAPQDSAIDLERVVAKSHESGLTLRDRVGATS
jgi:hypothetical protein